MTTIPQVTYRYELFLHFQPLCVWQTMQPMAAFALGDVVNPRTFRVADWPALENLVRQGSMLQVAGIEHAPYHLSDEQHLVHHVMIHCTSVPDTWGWRQAQWFTRNTPHALSREDAC